MSTAVRDIKGYKWLKMMLNCNVNELQDWEHWKKENADSEKQSLQYFNELRQAGIKSAERREAAMLKTFKDITGIIERQISRLKNEQIEIMERMQAAEDAVLSLPDADMKQTIWFLYIEGMESESVQSIMHCKAASIEKQAQMGLDILREKYQNENGK